MTEFLNKSKIRTINICLKRATKQKNRPQNN